MRRPLDIGDRRHHHHPGGLGGGTGGSTGGTGGSTGSGTGTGGTGPGSGGTGSTGVADQIANDMGQNESHPHGVPLSWDFANNSYVQNGNNVGSNRAAVQWFVVYQDAAQASASKNTRINIRRCEIWWKSKSTGQWHQGGSTTDNPQIETYAEDFSSGGGSVDVRHESDGTVSAALPQQNKNLHGYPARFAITDDVAGWVGVVQMRLIQADPNGPDDRNNSHFLGESGADYYPSTSGPGISNNPAIAGGKYKYIKNDWRSFAFTTADLKMSCPSIDLTGVLP